VRFNTGHPGFQREKTPDFFEQDQPKAARLRQFMEVK
jgi:hypothetical protein